MKGKLFQILNVDHEPIGLWYTEDTTITTTQIDDWWRSYDDSDQYDEEGEDGFSDHVAQIGYKIERVFTEEVII